MTKNQIPNAEIEAAFREAKGNMSKAAKIIGCTREALWIRVKKSEELARTLRKCRLEDEDENGPKTEEKILYDYLSEYILNNGLPSKYSTGVFGYMKYLQDKDKKKEQLREAACSSV